MSEALTKWLPFCRQHFLDFFKSSIDRKSLFLMFQLTVSIGSGIGLAAKMCSQAFYLN